MDASSQFSFARILRSRLGSAAALAAAVVAAGSLVAPTPLRSQAPAGLAGVSPAAMTAMLNQLYAQQGQMAANQTKIETQTAAVRDELRKLKIYSSRTGAGRR